MKTARYEILDGLRGYFLVFMMLNHLLFAGGFLLQHINHAELGYVQDAQGFVFLSGLIIGLLYTRIAGRGGLAALWEKARSRACDLFAYNAAVIAIVLVLAVLIPDSRQFWGDMLGVYQQPAVHAVSAVLMLYQPSFMDILPQYVLYILASPFLVWLVLRDRWVEVIAGSFLLWFSVQVGLHLVLGQQVDQLGAAVAPGFGLRAAFNPLAWQALFVGGLVLGAAIQSGKLQLDRLFPSDRTGPFWFCLGLVLLFMAYRLGSTYHFLPSALEHRIIALDNRSELSLIYVVNFVATTYALGWVLTAGVRSSSKIARSVGSTLQRLFALPFLNFLGKHSLQVYAFHVLAVYLVVWGDWAWGPFDQGTKSLIALTLIGSLWVPAKVHDLYLERKLRGGVRTGTATRGASQPAKAGGAA